MKMMNLFVCNGYRFVADLYNLFIDILFGCVFPNIAWNNRPKCWNNPAPLLLTRINFKLSVDK